MRMVGWIAGVIGLVAVTGNAPAQKPQTQSVVPAQGTHTHSMNSTGILVPYANACQERHLSKNFLGRLGAWLTYRPECTSLTDESNVVPRRAAIACYYPPGPAAPNCAPTHCAPRCASPRGPLTISLTFGWLSFMRGCPPELTTAKRTCAPVSGTSSRGGFSARACDSSFRCGPSAPPKCDVSCPPVNDGRGAPTLVSSPCRTPFSNWFSCNRAGGCGACGMGPLGRRGNLGCIADAPGNSTHVEWNSVPILDPNQMRPTGPQGPSIPLHSPTPVLSAPRLETPPPPAATPAAKPSN